MGFGVKILYSLIFDAYYCTDIFGDRISDYFNKKREARAFLKVYRSANKEDE